MRDYRPSTYGSAIAAVYDELTSGARTVYGWSWAEETTATVAALAELAGEGPLLELGIGTGRVALPLSARGHRVEGIDASADMVALLREKPGGEAVPVTVGDFARIDRPGPYSLVYVVYGTFFALHDQEEQIRCLADVRKRLTPGGRFVVETFVPDVGQFDRGQLLETMEIDADGVKLNATLHDPVNQVVDAQHVRITGRGVELHPVRLRYAWPAELDVMARLTGLRLESRRGGWLGEPFTASSVRHVSVYKAD